MRMETSKDRYVTPKEELAGKERLYKVLDEAQSETIISNNPEL